MLKFTVIAMRHPYSVLLILAAVASACKGEPETTAPVPLAPPAPAVLRRDVVASSLPSPHYHFEYDAAGAVLVRVTQAH